jgi:AraC-like DNA-binding protein
MATLLDFSRPLPLPRVTLLAFARRRTAFTHAAETLREWTILGSAAGEFRYRIGKREPEICRAGDFVICPPRVALAREIIGTADFYTVRFHWTARDAAAWTGPWTLRDAARRDSTLEQIRTCHDVLGLRASLAWANHLALDLLGQVALEARLAPPRGRAPDRAMLKAEERLRGDVASRVTLAELARGLGMDAFQLSRRFRAAYGVSPAVYRTRIRLQQARRLLLETDWTTERIAEACGFENAFYFSRVFRRELGQPPREYRREHRV